MAQPPPTPASSDIAGVHRDGAKIRATGKAPDPGQQKKLSAAAEEGAARPPYDPEISPEGNSQ